MSFDNYNKKPRLIEPKLAKYYIEKTKQKELNEKIKKEELIKQEEIIAQQNIVPEPWYKLMLLSIWEFIKENYGFFLIVTLIIILLYVRYIEVNNRKKKMKHIIEHINSQSNEDSNEDTTLNTSNF